MDIRIHNEILWLACVETERRSKGSIAPCRHFPLLVRGSWLNDINQFTIAADLFRQSSAAAKAPAFFRELWRLDLQDLLGRMKAGPPEAKAVAAAAEASCQVEAQNWVDDFGRYDPLDHFDVVPGKQDPKNPGRIVFDPDCVTKEVATWKKGEHWRSETIQAAIEETILDRMIGASSGDITAWENLSRFGRALHTVADFYAHTNYVELLLWSLAFCGALDQGIVDLLNRPDGFLHDGSYARCTCPTPAAGQPNPTRDVLFCYGDSPADTPLVSSIFDPSDTAYSLLNMYATQLEHAYDDVADAKSRDELFQLVLATAGRPQRWLIQGLWKISEEIRGVVRDAGQVVRGLLADWLKGQGQKAGRSATEKEAFDVTAHLVEKYEGKGADDWARAGRFRYLAYTLAADMAAQQGEAKAPWLPHHTLLSKDRPPRYPDELLRYRVGYLLAIETSTRFLTWYFSPKREPSVAMAIVNNMLRHPWQQVQGTAAKPGPNRLAVWSGLIGTASGLPARSLLDRTGGLP